MAGLQHAVTRADADARAAAVFAMLEADAAGQATQLRAAALSDMARLRSSAGALASAWRPARPGHAELTAVEFRTNALLRVGEDLFPGQDRDLACVSGHTAASGAHALVCGALWHTVARHNMMVDVWRRVFARAGISSSLEPHVKQLPQRLHAAGLPALPSRPTGSHPHDSKTVCATLTTSALSTSPALAVPSTPYGTQASHPATPSATAPPAAPLNAPPTARPMHPTPIAILPTQPASPVLLTDSPLAAEAPQTQAPPLQLQLPPLSHPCPPGPPALPSPPRPPSHTLHEAMLLHSTSPRAPDPERGDLLALLPSRPSIVADICVTHPLARPPLSGPQLVIQVRLLREGLA